MSDRAALVFVVADRDVAEPDLHSDLRARQVELFTRCRDKIVFLVDMTPGIELRDVTFEFAVRKFHGIALGDHAVEDVGGILGFHQMDAVRCNVEPDQFAFRTALRALHDDFEFPYLHGDFIVNALEYDGDDRPFQHAGVGCAHEHVFGAHDDVHRFVSLEIVHAVERLAAEFDLALTYDCSVKDIAFADEVCDECIGGLVIDVDGSADLLDDAVRHDDDGVRHREGLLLIVRDVNEGDPQTAVHLFELDLHFFAHFQIERAEGFVEEQDLRFVDDGARDRDALLLSARKRGDRTLFEALEIDERKRLFHLFADLLFGEPLFFRVFRAFVVAVCIENALAL